MALPASLDLTGTARSLLNIEVNTIIRDNMTAEQMPTLPHALLDIAGWYVGALCAQGMDIRPFFATPVERVPDLAVTWAEAQTFSTDELTLSSETFDRLRWAAKLLGIDHSAQAARIPPAKRAILDRICNNCDTIKEIFKHVGPDMAVFIGRRRVDIAAMKIERRSYYVPPDDLVALQKFWDIGVEEIVAQTIVFVTGDITTRIQEAFRHPGAETLFSVHRQSVDVSVACWHYLLDVVREIAGTAVRGLLGRAG